MDAHIISLVKERADIAQIIGEHVHLRASSQGYKGLCPFHQEKTPSFNVNTQRGFFHCFGCGKGGSVVDFVMEQHGMEFREALCWLAERVGVKITSSKGNEKVDRSAEALRLVTDLYHQQLISSPKGEAFRLYMRGRGFKEEGWQRFKIGAAWDDWQGMLEQLHGKISEEALLKAGLVGKSKNGRLYDWMRARVVFPIQDIGSHTVGFGGRLMVDDAKQPKYINTPETVHYRKSQVLFGLPQAVDAWQKSKRAIIVEGYFDVLCMHQHGFYEAVATCGSSLTSEHVALLKRYVKEVVLLFDGDSAGVRAATRSVTLFLEQGLEAQVALLPNNLDPDDFLNQQGPEVMHRILENAKPLLEYLAWATFRQFPQSIQGKQQALESLTNTLQVAKPATQALAVHHMADLLGIDPARVMKQMKTTQTKLPEQQSKEVITPLSITDREKRIFALLAWNPSLADVALKLFQPGDFSSEVARSLFNRLVVAHNATETPALGTSLGTALGTAIHDNTANHQHEEFLLRTLLAEKPLHVKATKDPSVALRAEAYYLKRPRLLELRRAWLQTIGTSQEELSYQRWQKVRQALAELKPARHTYQPPEEWRLQDHQLSSLTSSV